MTLRGDQHRSWHSHTRRERERACAGAEKTGTRAGFTLIELIVSSILLALFAGATASAVIKTVRSRDDTAARREAFARAELAASRIAADVTTTVRDPNLLFSRVLITDDGGDGIRNGDARDELLVFSRSLAPVRGDGVEANINEAGTREVQYRLVRTDESFARAGRGSGSPGMTLWRRVDPTADNAYDAGGVASPICDGITSLSIEAMDSQNWYETWDSDDYGYPHAVRVTVTAMSTGNRPVFATIRRTIALDRTPYPTGEPEDESATDDSTSEDASDSGGSGSGSGSSGGGGSGSGRGGGGGGSGGARPGTPGRPGGAPTPGGGTGGGGRPSGGGGSGGARGGGGGGAGGGGGR